MLAGFGTAYPISRGWRLDHAQNVICFYSRLVVWPLADRLRHEQSCQVHTFLDIAGPMGSKVLLFMLGAIPGGLVGFRLWKSASDVYQDPFIYRAQL